MTTADLPARAASRVRTLVSRVVAGGLRAPSGDARIDERGQRLLDRGQALLDRGADDAGLRAWLESAYTHAREFEAQEGAALTPRQRRLLDEVGDVLQDTAGPDGDGF